VDLGAAADFEEAAGLLMAAAEGGDKI
jgi:hypothetical protein